MTKGWPASSGYKVRVCLASGSNLTIPYPVTPIMDGNSGHVHFDQRYMGGEVISDQS